MFRLPCPTRFIQGFIAQVYDPVELFFSSSSYFLFTVSASVFLLFIFRLFFVVRIDSPSAWHQWPLGRENSSNQHYAITFSFF
jgi:hypothetical protein